MEFTEFMHDYCRYNNFRLKKNASEQECIDKFFWIYNKQFKKFDHKLLAQLQEGQWELGEELYWQTDIISMILDNTHLVADIYGCMLEECNEIPLQIVEACLYEDFVPHITFELAYTS